MNVGILGAGSIAKMHAQILTGMKDVHLLGFYNRTIQKAQEIAIPLNISVYDNPDLLIKDKDIDIIDICLATELHKEFAVSALKNDKNVVIELPLCYSIEDANIILGAAKCSEKLSFVAQFGRFQSQYRYIRQLIKNDKFGKIKSIYMNRKSQNYFASKDIILNLMIHDIDYLVWIFGKPKSIISYGIENESVSIMFHYDFMTAIIEGCTNMPKSFPFSTSLKIVGDRAAVDLNWYWGKEGPVNDLKLYENIDNPEVITVKDYDPYEAELNYIIEKINNNERNNDLSIESVFTSTEIAILCRKSLEEKREILLNGQTAPNRA